MLVKIALALIIFWLVGIFTPNSIGKVIYTLPVVAVALIMVSAHRRRLNNPNEN